MALAKRKLVFVLLLAAWPALAAAQVRLGGEFAVNTYTTGNQSGPAVASDAAGNFVVAWNDYAEEGSIGLFARRFDGAGNPGAVFHVNTYTTGIQAAPAVAFDPSGNFVIVWDSEQDAGTFGIYARRYDATGVPLGPAEFRVNANTAGDQGTPAVAFGGDGSLVVAWQDQDGSSSGVSARRYDPAGFPGPEFRVNTDTTGDQKAPAVAADSAGNFVIVWDSQTHPGDSLSVFGRRYDSSGAPVAGEFRVNVDTIASHAGSAVGMAPDGRFMVAWTTDADGDGSGVVARRFDAAGAPASGDLLVNTYTIGGQFAPRSRPMLAANSR
jgi:hypothetical protein